MIFNEDKCMNNTYEIIIGRKTIKDFLDYEGDLYFLHNPGKKNTGNNDEVCDQLIEYFIYTEEYEKCQEILDVKNETSLAFSL